MTLKELRISKGIKQETASKICHVPLRTYKRYENDASYEGSFKYNQMFELINNCSFIDEERNNNKPLKIAIAGIGYVGLSLAVLFSQDNEVTITDIIKDKIDLVNKKKSPFSDSDIEHYLKNKKLHLLATYSDEKAYQDKDIIIIATPTDFNPLTNSFNTNAVTSVIEMVNKINKSALVVIKSTIPIGFTKEMREKHPKLNIIFSPEFLREGKALFDNLYPSRIIVGSDHVTNKVKRFGTLLERHAKNLNKTIYMSSSEAEAVKLFSNAYLAMRVAYFNELDSYAKKKGLDTANIIKGMSRDSRIGDYYNNPSFGYGGYCLPKDSEQLQNSFVDIPNNNLIKAIVDSNQSRKEYIADDIISEAMSISHKPKEEIVIGIYSLAMKSGSDNYRSSASVDIMNLLIEKGVKVIVFDRNYPKSVANLEYFKQNSDLIITNRYSDVLKGVKDKVYTRDIYTRD